MSIKSSHADSHRQIVKSTSIISLGTFSSRILGFIRDIVIAHLLGTGMKADAFFVAQKIPNLLRDFIGEGAVNAAVVPVFSEYLYHKEKEAFLKLTSVVFVLALVILSVLTLLGIIFAPLIVRFIAPGFIEDPEKFSLTVFLTRLMYPYLIFIGLTAYSIGILYTVRSFWVPAFSPCLLNIAMILSALFAFYGMREPVIGLAIGVLAGGVLQLLWEMAALLKKGFRWHLPKILKEPGALKIGKLLIPRMVGSGVYQLTVLIDTFCASLGSVVGPGGISAIYYANRIIQFPMGIFSVALASVILPTLANFAQKKDLAAIQRTLIFSLENIFFIMCPITVFFLLFSKSVIQILFQRGEFGLYSTQITSSAMIFLSLGLFSFGGIKILVAAFYALQDTKTPVKVAVICLLINTALNFILMFPLKVGGITLASSIAGTIDFLLLFYVLNRRLGYLDSSLLLYFGKVTLAALLTGAVQFCLWNVLVLGSAMVKLLIMVVAGLVFYEILCLFLKIKQANKVWTWLGGLYKNNGSSAEN